MRASTLRRLTLTALVLGASLAASSACAEDDASASATGLESPFAREMRAHTYEVLMKSPWKALGWELLLPGAGNVYTGIRVNAAITIVTSLTGAGLWVAGAVTDNRPLFWSGVGTFAAGRAYGLVSAPLGAALLNGAFRRQLGVAGNF